MKSRLLKNILGITIAFFMVLSSLPMNIFASSTVKPTLSIRSHVQDIGWQDYANCGVTSIIEMGTTGKALRMEALEINANLPSGVTIKYRAHVQDIGWQDWVVADNKAQSNAVGTEGKALRMEAIQIALDGTEDYELRYRTHIQDIGWQNWVVASNSVISTTQNGFAGTTGKALRMEAIQIQIVEKESSKAKVDEKAQAEAQKQAQAEADKQAQAEAQKRAQAEAEAKAKEQANAEAQRQAQVEAETKAKEQAQAEAQRQAQVEAEAKAKEQADAEAQRQAQVEAEAKAKEQAQEEAQKQAQAEAEKRAQEEAQKQTQAETQKHTHIYTNWTVTVEPTCKSTGLKTRQCTSCGEIETQIVERNNNHNLVRTPELDKPATCTEYGAVYKKCTICGDVFFSVIQPLGGHIWDTEYTVDKEATCTEYGLKSIHCTRENCTETKNQVTIRPTGHNIVSTIVSNTCTEGKTIEEKCTKCNYTKTKTDKTGVKQHVYSNYVSDNNATCSKDGTKTATCTVCGSKNTIVDVGSKLNHTFKTISDKVLPTCEKEGKEASKRCTVCGTVEEGATIKPLGHNLIRYSTNSVCEGKTAELECTRCHFTIFDNEVKAFGHGHTWNDDFTECTKCKGSDVVWWSYWKNGHKSGVIWFAGFTCDLDHCIGLTDTHSGKKVNTILEGRRGDVDYIAMKAPTARDGYKFDSWIDLSTGEKVTTKYDASKKGVQGQTGINGDTIYVHWKDMCKGFEPQYVLQ